MSEQHNILEIENLTAAFLFNGKPVPVIENVSFNIRDGEILGVVGESGSGKSVTAKTVMRLIPSPPISIPEGKIILDGKSVLDLCEKEMQHLRGNVVSMIFQEPMTSLNPVFTCGNQLIEAIRQHQKVTRPQAYKLALDVLNKVGISIPEQRMKAYPHELSGGMRQRVMIAMALSCKPKLLIADEPTTALDPTIQAQILELIVSLQKEDNMSVLYITHDLGVVAETCHRVVVMYAGRVMEIATVEELFREPRHPYTMGLMHAIPHMGETKKRLYVIRGMVPHITQMVSGCCFHTRCPYATSECTQTCPPLRDFGKGHMVRCFQDENRREGQELWRC